MKYHFKIHKEGNQYWAECLELKGCFTQGKNLEELHKNMGEALNLYIEEPVDSKYLAPLPDKKIKKTKSIVEVALDSKIALAFLIRRYRIKYKMTQEQAAKALGFKNIYSYQRLESGKSNPTLEILLQLRKLFPSLSVDLVFS